ncbi:MAG: PEP-CTERM sorting domain-containing protein, partial [Aeromonadaceae bacterium]
FGGTVLAPNAILTLTNSNEVIGGVYVYSLTQNGKILATNFTEAALTSITAAVPEPETYALMGLGLVMLGWRHKKSRATSLATA